MIKKTIKKILFSGFSYIFVSSIINKVISFLSNSIIIHLLSKTEYGAYTYAYNIISFGLIIAGLGIPSALLQILCEKHKERGEILKIYKYGSSVAILFNFLLGIVFGMVALHIPLTMNMAAPYLLLLSFIPFFDTCINLQLTYMRSLLMTRQYAIATNINTILLAAFTILGAYCGQVKGIILGRYFAYIISIVLLQWMFKLPFFVSFIKIEREQKKDIFKIALISMANNGLSEFLYLIDIFVMGLTIASEAMIASYKVATIIPSALMFIPSTVMIYAYPYFAQNKDNKIWLKKRYKELLLGLGGLNLFISISFIALARIIIVIFFGETYNDSVWIFRVLMLNYFVASTFRIISGNLLVTQRKLKFNFYVALFSGIINIIGNFMLIPRFGSWGAVTTTVSVVIITSILSTYKLCHIIYKEGI